MTDESSSSPDKGAGRLFLGVPVTDEVRQALVQQLGPVSLAGRLVPPDKWHLTLRFLGDTPHAALNRLRETLRASPFPSPFDIEFGALGAFPNAARASVLWVGIVHGSDPLRSLAAEVEAAVRRSGFAAETRPFSSHLTLSRLQPPRDVRPLIESVPALSARMLVNEVVLFRSHLGRGPSRYEALDRFSLGSSP